MASKTFVLVVVVVLILAVLATPTLQATAPSQPTYLNYFCLPDSGNYTQNSTYHRSLKTALSDLDSNSSFLSFYATSADTVYGRYYCRQDLPLRTCSACVHAATAQIVADCSDYKEAVIWYEQCTLLYLNSTSRIETIDVASPYNMWYTPKNVSDPNKFSPVLEATMDQLINETAYGPGSERFATVEAHVSGLQKLYSLAQCIPDRGGLLCERCLRKALRNIDLCCNEYADMAFFYPSCQLRYSVLAPFYEFSSSPPPAGSPPPPAVASTGPPPPPANESSTPLGNDAVARKYKNILKLCVAVTVLLLGI